MKTSLSNEIGNPVFVLGFLDSWFSEPKDQIRICLKNPIIRKADKDKIFNDQILISKEDHINVFTSKDYWKSLGFERYTMIYFGGYIHQYQRSNGSIDFGVRSVETLQIEDQLSYIRKSIKTAYEVLDGEELLNQIDEFIFPLIHKTLTAVKDSGDLLPTRIRNYSECLRIIDRYIQSLKNCKQKVKYLLNTRSYRRSLKKKNSNLGIIKTLKGV